MIRKIIFILVGCLVALSSCQWDGKSGNTADVDVRVARYDRLQYEYVTMNSFSALQKMNTDYPQVTKLLIEDVLAIGEVDDMKINDRMLEYYSDSTLLTLMHDAEEKFKDLSWVEEKLTKGFKRLKKEVPALFVPHFYAQIAALNQSVVVGIVFWALVLISIWGRIILYINASIMTINVAVWSLIVLFRIVLPFIC